ncbi:MAG: UTP--glucose-1-phosphate uridylyltransferase GalU [Alphaproteobacteria bacterium]|nr:UTP--glucose-1-phosphate uridylyltransferase GalU [Alphaproteobacteria bacterium]
MTRVRKAVFPVGGLGTRFLPATKAMPKEMLSIVDTPLIEYAVEEARAAGIEQFIFVTGRGKAAIENHFDHSFELHHALANKGQAALEEIVKRSRLPAGTVSYTRQQEPLGLGHAVWCARHLVGNEPFAVLLADDLIKADAPCLAQMLAVHETAGGNLVAVMDVPREHTSRYGILTPGEADSRLVAVEGLVEKPSPDAAPSTLAVIGRYILDGAIFDRLATLEGGTGGEIQLTDAMATLIGEQPFHGYRFAGERYDCGSKLGFLEATLAFALDRQDLAEGLRSLLRKYAEQH